MDRRHLRARSETGWEWDGLPANGGNPLYAHRRNIYSDGQKRKSRGCVIIYLGYLCLTTGASVDES